MSQSYIVILAAGQGKRMHSDLPKVLHPVGERCLLEHVVDAAAASQPESVLVVLDEALRARGRRLCGTRRARLKRCSDIPTNRC